MKVSSGTLEVLKQCAKINNHLVISKGNSIRTLTEKKNRMLVATVPDEFPVEFRVHDLSGFLRQLALFDEPELDFRDDRIIITDSYGSMAEYWYSNKEDLIYVDRAFNLDNFYVDFDLPAIALDKVIRASGANSVEDVGFASDGSNVIIKALNKKKPKRIFSVDLGACDKQFEVYLKHAKKNKLILMPLDYKVSISEQGILRFRSGFEDVQIDYYIACERDFTFGEKKDDIPF